MKAFAQTFESAGKLVKFLNDEKITKENIVACVYVADPVYHHHQWSLVYYGK